MPAALTTWLTRHWPAYRAKRSKKIATPGYFLNWLGFDDEAIENLASEHGLQFESFLPDTPAQQFDPSFHRSTNGSDGVPDCPPALEAAAHYAACIETNSLLSEYDPDHAHVQQHWKTELARVYREIQAKFDQSRPALVLMVQGYEPHNAAARVAALDLKIPFLTLENTAVSNRMLWDNVSGITNHSLAQNYFWRFNQSITDDDANRYGEQLIRQTKSLKSNEHSSPMTCDLDSNRPEDGGATVRPKLLFLGQVYTDSAVIFGLNYWSSPIDLIEHSVRWAAQNGFDFVAKLHPKESSGVNTINSRPYDQLTRKKMDASAEIQSWLSRTHSIVDADNRLDTFQLIESADIVVTLSSQAGLEAAIRGKTVVLGGNALYGNLGFTFEAPRPELFEAVMNAAWNFRGSNLKPHQTLLARKFATIFFNEYCREKSVDGLAGLIRENQYR